ncbi:MAG: tRNA lysidine(34) synthetase TilS [Pseudomonadota bacterium]|nr:tRNA lysidine(34) synthetase TilS [Pseudomonadota bacterium]
MAAPLGADEFSALMAALGPFENEPVVAVAVSGGPDSMTLAALALHWARDRGGRVEGLIVDHGLRPDSTDEARRVAEWLGSLGIGRRILTWQGNKPRSDVQAIARTARYGLMGDWCRHSGVAHLLLGHHQDDLAETFVLRLERHSGLDGLAAMAAIVETRHGRLLRPLLTVPQARLRATLHEHQLPSVDDPSNRDRRYGRVRVRQMMPYLADDGVTAVRLARTALAMGRGRCFMDHAVARRLARAAAPHGAGFCWLDPTAYGAAPDEVARRALTRVLLYVGGGGPYPPRSERLERLHRAIADGALDGGRTLAGCRILPRRRGLLVCREPGRVFDTVALQAGDSVAWDWRFRICLGAGASGGYSIRRLGFKGRTAVAESPGDRGDCPVPAAVQPSLPAIFDLDGVVAVPHLNFVRENSGERAIEGLTAVFRPVHFLYPAGFAFAGAGE